ncbi:hypothetical protein FACS1894190_17790 [Spirochaetia bacterium]|nr:hypothetical protein FACS1894190_17790 [Spirochaetia bacterium]
MSVKLESGTNYIEVVAVNEVNYGVKTLDVKSTVNAIQEKPDLWLLSIGINDYANFPANGWADLESAVGDATKMFSLFDGQNNKRFKNIHKVIVADGTVNKPTKQNILKNMEMLKQAKSNDVIFLFIAAHGITEEEVYYFLSSDVKFNSSKDIDLKYAVNIDEIIKSTDMPGKKIVFIDTCQSGGVDNNKLIRTLRNRSTVIFTAAKQNEFSNETPDYGGVFTYSVVEGINNNPLNKRSITLQDLEHYVANRINDLLPRLKKNKQHPVMIIPNGYKNFVMAEYE